VCSTLLVAHKYVLDVVLLEQLVIDKEYCPARVAKHMFDSLILEETDENLGTVQFHINLRFSCGPPSQALPA
jgi:flavin-dependent dehydrogenase